MSNPEHHPAGAAPTPLGGSEPALEMRGIVKRFGDYTALDRVDFELAQGEVHALLGENGAGKTTLMNVATGIIDADAGTIAVGGREARIRSPRDATRLGIGMVHQHFRLVRNFTVAENVHLGLGGVGRLVSRRELERRTAEWSERFGFDVDPSARVAELSVGQLQRVAIMRALVRGANILVLDEPTAVLTPQAASQLFSIIRGMVAEGRTVVFISHKLDEVIEIADRISVLRGGARIATLPKEECTTVSLARLMVGHEMKEVRPRPREHQGDPLLVAQGLRTGEADRRGALKDVDVAVLGGEILGVAGVSGNGQAELAQVLTGMLKPAAGTVRVGDRELGGAGARAFGKAGVGHVPEDLRIGLSLEQTIEMNAVMKVVEQPPVRRGPFLVRSAIRPYARELLERGGLAALEVTRRAGTLSGGQAQRLVIQRELRAGNRALVAVHPSRGLDVAATQAVHEALLDARSHGAGVLLVSEDLDELFELSDRIAVMYEGRIAATLERAAFDREQVGLLMGGGGR
ncbi:MAG: ABC transporter ATP-binding protein [Actinobacteria bacterium]|nr:ABC transporter ATP-binding protein [Actinomycetota bacterium]